MLADDPADNLSVWEVYQKPFYNWLSSTRLAEMRFVLPIAEFLKIKLYQKIGVKGRDQVLTRYVIDRLITKLPGYGGELDVKVYAYPTLPGAIGPNTTEIRNMVIWLAIEFYNHPDDNLVDVYVRAYASRDKSRRLTVSGLTVFYVKSTYTDFPRIDEEFSVELNGSELLLISDLRNYIPPGYDDVQPTQITVELLQSPDYFIIS
jgi:hypothetical protein